MHMQTRHGRWISVAVVLVAFAGVALFETAAFGERAPGPVSVAGPISPCPSGPDVDGDGDLDWDDYATMAPCLLGPGAGVDVGCECFDLDGNLAVDLGDVQRFANDFTIGEGCFIDGVFYAPGRRDAAPNNCRICDPTQSTTDWSIVATGVVCNPGSGDLCDRPEMCDGVSAQCPDDVFEPATTVCKPGSGDSCDPPEFCPGVADMPCPTNSFASADVICRPGSGDVCDPPEHCPGLPGRPCPDDSVAPEGIVCNPGSGDGCDPPERCSGVPGEACPADVFEPASTVCRRGSGDACDPDEFCPGKPDLPCPEDQVTALGTICREGSRDICDPTERCLGIPGLPCPDDVVRDSSLICNPGSGDMCDPAERCPGVAGEPCPDDTFEPASTVCNAGSGDGCDPDEHCPGVPDEPCPEDSFKPDTQVCRGAQGVCDVAELCPGVPDEPCPDDAKLGNETVCREAVDICDAEEVCDGIHNPCPPDAFKSADTLCRGAGVTILEDGTLVIDGDGLCDVPEYCTGLSAHCPPDRLRPEGALCRDRAGVCDTAKEYCSGSSKHCPPDVSAAGHRCRIAYGFCDEPEYCDPADPAYPDCPADTVKPAGTLCRDLGPDGFPNFQACDVQEFCDGQSTACPTDEGLPVDAACTRGDGSSGACEDVGQPKLKCVEAGAVVDGDLCSADFECASGNCGEQLDRSFRCMPANLVGVGGACDGRDFFYEGDPDGRQCMADSGEQLWCCKNGLPAATGQTGTCSECCRSNDTQGGTGKGVVGCENPNRFGSRTECCSGRCSDPSNDPYNCGDCGINCYDELDICKTAVIKCDGGSGVGQPGTCVFETPCDGAAGEVCYDNCFSCAIMGTCATCQSVATCSQVCPDCHIIGGDNWCLYCDSDADCDPGQTCQSGCGSSDGSAIIFCTSPSYCIWEPGDCVN